MKEFHVNRLETSDLQFVVVTPESINTYTTKWQYAEKAFDITHTRKDENALGIKHELEGNEYTALVNYLERKAYKKHYWKRLKPRKDRQK